MALTNMASPYFAYWKRRRNAIPHLSSDFGNAIDKVCRYTRDWIQRIKIAKPRERLIRAPKTLFPVTYSCIVWTQIHCCRFTIKIAIVRNRSTTHLRWPIRRWTWNGNTRKITQRGWCYKRIFPVAATTMDRPQKFLDAHPIPNWIVSKKIKSMGKGRWAAVDKVAGKIYCRIEGNMSADRNRITAGHTYQRPTHWNGMCTRTIENLNLKKTCWTTRQWSCCTRSSGWKIELLRKLVTSLNGKIESNRADDDQKWNANISCKHRAFVDMEGNIWRANDSPKKDSEWKCLSSVHFVFNSNAIGNSEDKPKCVKPSACMMWKIPEPLITHHSIILCDWEK